MPKITAAAVSRRLAERFIRSEPLPSGIRGYRPLGAGFSVRAGSGGGAYVEYVPGRFRDGDARRKAMAETLEQYADYLSEWYITEMDEDDYAGDPVLVIRGFRP
jgi:hypothetical protein